MKMFHSAHRHRNLFLLGRIPQNKKAELTSGLSFGSSAIFSPKKTRRFPSPPRERVGVIGIGFFEIIFL